MAGSVRGDRLAWDPPSNRSGRPSSARISSTHAGATPMRRVLFVCEGNIHRSRTAADLYAAPPILEVRSAGLADPARVQVTEDLIAWAFRTTFNARSRNC